MSPYPRTKSACRHPFPPPPAHRQGRHAGRRAATWDHFPCTTGTTTTKSKNCTAGATPSRRRHQIEGSPVQIPPARRRLPPIEPSAVNPRRRSVRDHMSSQRGPSTVRTQFRPRVRTQPPHFFPDGKKCENSLEFPHRHRQEIDSMRKNPVLGENLEDLRHHPPEPEELEWQCSARQAAAKKSTR